MTDLDIGLDKMNRLGYSLVRIGKRWEFAAGDTPKLPGDALRMGHWTTPKDALVALANRAEK